MSVEIFYNPKTAIFGKKWSKSTFSEKRLKIHDCESYKAVKYKNTDTFTLDMMRILIFRGNFLT